MRAPVTSAALAWLEERDPDRRLFLFLHYFDPHAPYQAPEPYPRLYPVDDEETDGSMRSLQQLRASSEQRDQRHPDWQSAATPRRSAYVDQQLGASAGGAGGGRAPGRSSALILTFGPRGERIGHWEIWDHGESVYGRPCGCPSSCVAPPASSGGCGAGAGSVIDLLPTALENHSACRRLRSCLG